MDPRFLPHDSHLGGTDEFERVDPQLRRLAARPKHWASPLVARLLRRRRRTRPVAAGNSSG